MQAFGNKVNETTKPSWQRRAKRLLRLTSSARRSDEVGLGAPLGGQALVEFALILPILMLIIVGILEFGLAYFDADKVDFSTREVARRMAICGNACDMTVPIVTGTDSVYQLDLKDLDAIANNYGGPINPSMVDPALVKYVWIQRTYSDGRAIPVSGTTSGLVYDNTRQDYRRFFNYFTYVQNWKSLNMAVPFTITTNCSGSDPWTHGANREYLNVANIPLYSNSGNNCGGWPSSPTTQNSLIRRNICEPTDRFFVEIGYTHNWVTPLIPNTSGGTILKSRVFMKIEPRYFATALSNGQANPACN
jgi:hypothetical protein